MGRGSSPDCLPPFSWCVLVMARQCSHVRPFAFAAAEVQQQPGGPGGNPPPQQPPAPVQCKFPILICLVPFVRDYDYLKEVKRRT